MLARVGADDAGAAYGSRLAGLGIDSSGHRHERHAPTGTALITVDEQGENSIIVIAGANGEADPALSARPGASGPATCCSARSRWTWRPSRAAARGPRAGARVVINLAPYAALPPDVIALADPVVVNESEMALLADSDLVPESLLVTFGAAGARWGARGWTAYRCRRRGRRHGRGRRRLLRSAGGALAAGADRQTALEAANAAGAAAVRWAGAQPDAAL